VAIDVPSYNQQFIQTTQTTGKPYNDATQYGVQIHSVPDKGGATHYWRVVGVHHLTGNENKGNHHAYADVLDENGQRVNGARLVLVQEGAGPLHAVVDKPANEAGTNFPMWSNTRGTLSVSWPADHPLPSEQVGVLRTDHADEEAGNTWGHHSFYVVFQKMAVSQETALPPATEPEPVVDPRTGGDEAASLEETIAAVGQPKIIPLNPDAMFYKVAQQQGLGERLTEEYDVEYQGKNYRAQIYEKGIVYAEVGDWGNVKIIPRTN